MVWLLFLAWAWPLALAAISPFARAWWTPALGALPALAAALLVPIGETLELPWLLLGTFLGLDETSRAFLLFTSILWTAAGVYAAASFRGTANAGRFRTFFMLAMAGNLWLIVGQDLISFYIGFALMGLASYGLVVHDGSASALRAGRVYLVMAIAGEVAVFVALVLAAHHTGSMTPRPEDMVGLSNLAIGLAIFGLGIKAGLVPLHVWLPLAHPAAPIPASAVLSGTMIKVALLGWMRLIPFGEVALPDWGGALVVAGTLAMLLAVPIGLVQSNPKVVLAYSSVGKMGLLITVLGVVLIEPGLAPVGLAAVTLYAAHHALVKGGLFLGIGLRKGSNVPRLAVLAGLALLAVALAGAPLTSGAVAKYGLKPLLDATTLPWVPAAVAMGTLLTTLLMVRFMWIAWATESSPSAAYRWGGIAWVMLIVLVVAFPFVLGEPAAWFVNGPEVALALMIGLATALIAWRLPGLLRRIIGTVPAGDVLLVVRPVLAVVVWIGRGVAGLYRPIPRFVSRRGMGVARAFDAPNPDPERALRNWSTAGALWLGATAGLLVMLALDERSTASIAGSGDDRAVAMHDEGGPVDSAVSGGSAAMVPESGLEPAAGVTGSEASPLATGLSGPPSVPANAEVADSESETSTHEDAIDDSSSDRTDLPPEDGVEPESVMAAATAEEAEPLPTIEASELKHTSVEDRSVVSRSEQGRAMVDESPEVVPESLDRVSDPLDVADEIASAQGAVDASAFEEQVNIDVLGAAETADLVGAPSIQGLVDPTENPLGESASAAEQKSVSHTDFCSKAARSNRPVHGGTVKTVPGLLLPCTSETSATGTRNGSSEMTSAAKSAGVCPPFERSITYPLVVRDADEARLQVVVSRCERDGTGRAIPLDAPAMSSSLIEIVQRSLDDLGMDPGPADGLMGPRTRAAIRRFQTAEGVRADGQVTFELVDRLAGASDR